MTKSNRHTSNVNEESLINLDHGFNFYGLLTLLQGNTQCSNELYELFVVLYKREQQQIDSMKHEFNDKNKINNVPFSYSNLTKMFQKQLDEASYELMLHARQVKAQMDRIIDNWENDTNFIQSASTSVLPSKKKATSAVRKPAVTKSKKK